MNVTSLKLLTPGGNPTTRPPHLMSFVPVPELIEVAVSSSNGFIKPVAASTVWPVKTKLEKVPVMKPEEMLSARPHGTNMRTARRNAKHAGQVTTRLTFNVSSRCQRMES